MSSRIPMFCMYSFEFQNVYLGSVSISLVNLSSWVISRQILSDSSKLVGKWHYLGHGPNLSCPIIIVVFKYQVCSLKHWANHKSVNSRCLSQICSNMFGHFGEENKNPCRRSQHSLLFSLRDVDCQYLQHIARCT